MNIKEDKELLELLDHWNSMSIAQKKGLLALAREVDTASSLIEDSVTNLSDRFLKLAALAQNQSKRINEFAETSYCVEFEGEKASLSEVFQRIDDNLSETFSKIILLSKNAVSLSYSVEDADQKLSNLLGELGDAQRENIKEIRRDLNQAKALIGNVATIDVTHKLEMKDRLVELMEYAIRQSAHVEEALVESAQESQVLSDNISEIVTKIQFQDRTSQRLGHISSTLRVVCDLIDKVLLEAKNDGLGNQELNRRWIEMLISDMNLGEMKERFVKHALLDQCDDLFKDSDQSTQKVDHSDASDDIELF